jgi:hypothetical protein
MKQVIQLSPWRMQKYWELAKPIGLKIIEERKKESDKK